MAERSNVPTRRTLLGAASAFGLGGALFAAPAVGKARAAHDPLPALVAERKRLNKSFAFPSDPDEEDRAMTRFSSADKALCNQIVDTVAVSIAGIVAQLELLEDLAFDCGSNWADERDHRLLDSIIDGVRGLAAGGAA